MEIRQNSDLEEVHQPPTRQNVLLDYVIAQSVDLQELVALPKPPSEKEISAEESSNKLTEKIDINQIIDD